MKWARLANGLDVTAIGLGSAPLGGLFTPVSDADAEATLEAAWSAGIRFYDTAPLYGFGLAERRFGAFLRQQKRDSYVISTRSAACCARRTAPPPRTTTTRARRPSGRCSTSPMTA